jgi:uncharacterized membrane protein
MARPTRSVAGRFPLRFALLLAGGAAFVKLTSHSLPDVVASHFDGSGAANGFSARSAYVALMLLFTVGMPALLVVISALGLTTRARGINLPNRDYWLAPERKAETVAWLNRHMVRFAGVLAVFLCYVHWLVVRANEAKPPHLSTPWITSGLVAFVVFALIWTRLLVRHFRSAPANAR